METASVESLSNLLSRSRLSAEEIRTLRQRQEQSAGEVVGGSTPCNALMDE
jgi:hypothetical protein